MTWGTEVTGSAYVYQSVSGKVLSDLMPEWGWKSRYTSFVNRGDTGTHEGYIGDIGIRFIRRMGKSKVWCMVVFLVKDETTLAKKDVEFWFEIPEVFNEAMEMLNARQ